MMKSIKFFSNKTWIILIIVIVLITSGVGVYFYIKKKNTLVFHDENSGLTLDIPRGWDELDKKQIAQYNPYAHFAFKKEDRERTILSFASEEFPGKTNFKIQDSMKVLDESLPKAISSFSKIDSKEIDIAETKGLQYDFNYKTGGINIITGSTNEEVDMIQRKVFFLKNERMYYFDFAASSNEYKRDVKEFNKIIKSLKIE